MTFESPIYFSSICPVSHYPLLCCLLHYFSFWCPLDLGPNFSDTISSPAKPSGWCPTRSNGGGGHFLNYINNMTMSSKTTLPYYFNNWGYVKPFLNMLIFTLSNWVSILIFWILQSTKAFSSPWYWRACSCFVVIGQQSTL